MHRASHSRKHQSIVSVPCGDIKPGLSPNRTESEGQRVTPNALCWWSKQTLPEAPTAQSYDQIIPAPSVSLHPSPSPGSFGHQLSKEAAPCPVSDATHTKQEGNAGWHPLVQADWLYLHILIPATNKTSLIPRLEEGAKRNSSKEEEPSGVEMGLRMSVAGTSGSKAGQTFGERTRMQGDALVGQRSLSTRSTLGMALGWKNKWNVPITLLREDFLEP